MRTELFIFPLSIALTLVQGLLAAVIFDRGTNLSLSAHVHQTQPLDIESEVSLNNNSWVRHVKKRAVSESPFMYTKTLTEDQRLFLLSFHITKRTDVEPPAANMKMLEWSMELEAMAMLRASHCRRISQRDRELNIDVSLDEKGHSALERWWEGRKDYDLPSRTCKNPPRDTDEWKCEQYTRMIWADADKIGCGIQRCDLHFSVACLYSPAVNVPGEPAYMIGERCSLCNASTPFCFKKQCISKDHCTELRASECSCLLKCQNCGVLDQEKCVCRCKEGWDGTDCSIPCRDEHPFCNIHPGYHDTNSCLLMEDKVKNKYCRQMCNECKTLTLTGSKCCDGILCPLGQVLDLTKCACTLLCPGPQCYGRAARLNLEPWILISVTIIVRIYLKVTYLY